MLNYKEVKSRILSYGGTRVVYIRSIKGTEQSTDLRSAPGRV